MCQGQFLGDQRDPRCLGPRILRSGAGLDGSREGMGWGGADLVLVPWQGCSPARLHTSQCDEPVRGSLPPPPPEGCRSAGKLSVRPPPPPLPQFLQRPGATSPGEGGGGTHPPSPCTLKPCYSPQGLSGWGDPQGYPPPPQPRAHGPPHPPSSDSPGSPQGSPPPGAERFSAAMVQRRAHRRAVGGSGTHGPGRFWRLPAAP